MGLRVWQEKICLVCGNERRRIFRSEIKQAQGYAKYATRVHELIADRNPALRDVMAQREAENQARLKDSTQAVLNTGMMLGELKAYNGETITLFEQLAGGDPYLLQRIAALRRTLELDE